MEGEFQESDVVFRADRAFKLDGDGEEDCISAIEGMNGEGMRKKMKTAALNKKSRSVPVNIPVNSWFGYVDSNLDADYDGDLVPPHVIVGRRLAAKMTAFSVCTGNGRTLKGRDLSEVRNSVLRMTGFLET